MNQAFLNKIKRLAIIAMFSDDYLMETLVLKGGNAIDLIYKMAFRSSIDLDFSMADEFNKDDLRKIEGKIQNVLQSTFKEEGFVAFDIKFEEKPEIVTPDMAQFWGGYSLEFKLIEVKKYGKLHNNRDKMSKSAVILRPDLKKRFHIDISKFEYCEEKRAEYLDDFKIFVYSPEMIVFEKLRAICQQMEEYAEIVVNPSRRARAKDFFDIYTVLGQHPIDMASGHCIELLKNIFKAKKVPISFLKLIPNYREYHRSDFLTVEDTIDPGFNLEGYDYYFDYVVNRIRVLKPFWEKQTPL